MNSDINKPILLDAHFDILMDVSIQRSKGKRKVIESQYLDDFKKGGFSIITAAVFVDSIFLPEMALRKALEQISALYAEIEESKDKIMICKSYDDVLCAIESSKLGIILSLEGVEPIYNDLNLLRIFYELGVRGVGLTWSRRNFAADGSSFSINESDKTEGGLTDFGYSLVKEAEKQGMFIDVSHLNDAGFKDVARISQKPFIASHSNCRSLCNISRNITDKQIKAIADSEGIICLNANSIIVASEDENSTIEHFVNHIEHIVNLVGIDYVGFGFDFCDRFMKYISEEDIKMLKRVPFDVVKGHSNINKVLDLLSNKGYSNDDIQKIGYKNYLRVLKNTLK